MALMIAVADESRRMGCSMKVVVYHAIRRGVGAESCTGARRAILCHRFVLEGAYGYVGGMLRHLELSMARLMIDWHSMSYCGPEFGVVRTAVILYVASCVQMRSAMDISCPTHRRSGSPPMADRACGVVAYVYSGLPMLEMMAKAQMVCDAILLGWL